MEQHNDTAASDLKNKNGEKSTKNGVEQIFYDGYWIRYYSPPEDTWSAKKNLIANLTKRTFHHTEPGINTPGENLDLARRTYEQAESEEEKRVNAAMLAGALFNRAADIITAVVDLEVKGVHLRSENELVQQCGQCLEEAMELGKSVRHFSGNEGIDELWGEPLKAFTLPISDFYKSRYVKIAQTKRDIDEIERVLKKTLGSIEEISEVWPVLKDFAKYAKLNCEIMKIDPDYFTIWPKFVTCSEKIKVQADSILDTNRGYIEQEILDGCNLLKLGRNLIRFISGARVPMPKTMDRFLADCEEFSNKREG